MAFRITIKNHISNTLLTSLLITLLPASCITTGTQTPVNVQPHKPHSYDSHHYLHLLDPPTTTTTTTSTETPHLPPGHVTYLNSSVILRRSNITAQAGDTVFLPCEVPHFLEEEVQVSWVRRKDWHILTSGLQMYTRDQKFRVHHTAELKEWTLSIKYVAVNDSGTYECQMVDATQSLSHLVELTVNSAVATIPGNGEYHVDQGSTISLMCLINHTTTSPQFVFWYHNSRMLNFDRHRGGITVTVENKPEMKSHVKSHLTITDATTTDSGNYSCAAANTESDTITVYITQVNHVAAVQPRAMGGCQVSIPPSSWQVITVGMIVMLLNHTYDPH